MAIFQKSCLVVAGLACLLCFAGILSSASAIWQPTAVLFCVTIALGLGALPSLSGYQFTAWIIAAVTSAMIYPQRFLQAGPFDVAIFEIPAIDFKNPWLVLIIVQLVMFGMGTKMSIRDFAGVAKMPYPVFIGVSLQFLIMPFSGYALAKLFGFSPEIAAGIVLIGSCSSGLASNVMCYLANANLALSITLTAVATLLAPLATPFWMQKLAGELVEVDALGMTVQIIKIVVVPIGAAMLHDYLKNTAPSRRSQITALGLFAATLAITLGVAVNLPPSAKESILILGGAVCFALAYHHASRRFSWIEQRVHLLAMMGIVYFTTVTTAAGRDHLLLAGLALLCAAVIHNLVGYTLGYSMSRLVGLDKQSALTVAFEVGMQNGGMASGLASYMGKLGTVGLAAAVFSPWMNVTGSILANIVQRFSQPQVSEHEEVLLLSLEDEEHAASP